MYRRHPSCERCEKGGDSIVVVVRECESILIPNEFSPCGQSHLPPFRHPRPLRRGPGEIAVHGQLFAEAPAELRNLGAGRFADVSDRARVRMGRWGWAARFIDVTNDGYDDIISPNGFLTGRAKDDL